MFTSQSYFSNCESTLFSSKLAIISYYGTYGNGFDGCNVGGADKPFVAESTR